jgi:gelsolin
MLKPKTYKIAESNIANLGTAVEKKVKEEAAKGEKQWVGIGKSVGLQIWRIEKFKVVPVNEKEYGKFHSDDSYIVLKTYKKDPKSDKLSYDVHFWLGMTTSTDEAGTAAYKTVELDDVLGGRPVQHREVEGYESAQFLSYFSSKGGIRILEGGVSSGFQHVGEKNYKPRLLWLKGRKNVRIVEVPLTGKSLNSGDVFVLDAGLKVYQWNGIKSSPMERTRAAQLLQSLEEERKKIQSVVYTEGDKDAKPFWDLLGGEVKPASENVAGDDEWEKKTEKSLYRLSDASGKMTFTLVASEGGKAAADKKVEAKVKKSQLKSDDVYVLDVSTEVFAWIGSKASVKEKTMALQYCQDYLNFSKKPAWTPITRMFEGHENHLFEQSFSS